MQIPMRRGQKDQSIDSEEGAFYLTEEGLQKLKDELARLEHAHPKVAEELFRAQQMGDLSENAEYQDAKHRLSGMNTRITIVKERIKRAVIIQKPVGDAAIIIMGSTVLVEVNSKEKTFQIVGPQEANPSQGRISHLSPLGVALLGHRAGEEVVVKTEGGETRYTIKDIR